MNGRIFLLISMFVPETVDGFRATIGVCCEFSHPLATGGMMNASSFENLLQAHTRRRDLGGVECHAYLCEGSRSTPVEMTE
jgi:hypothetical protein